MDRHETRTAVWVILERNNKVFMIRRQNTGWADGYLTLPAGHVDKGSFVRESVVIEAKEEAVVDIEIADLSLIHVDYLLDEYVNFYFKAEKWQGEPKIGEPHLASECVWVSPDEIPNDCVPQVKNLFKKTHQNINFSEITRSDISGL
ncbi:MAG: 8-oxo-dGTP diphosphatase [Candidatus Azotimanducaceae bacterium]|jgi:8-oxo-dGTP diphosphatase